MELLHRQAFFIGFYCGTDDYKSDLIAVKHIDGKYGKAFYGVEVFGKDVGNRIEVYVRVHIGGVDRAYYHDCGQIGFAWNWQEAKEKFGNITFDGRYFSLLFDLAVFHNIDAVKNIYRTVVVRYYQYSCIVFVGDLLQ